MSTKEKSRKCTEFFFFFFLPLALFNSLTKSKSSFEVFSLSFEVFSLFRKQLSIRVEEQQPQLEALAA